jgi:hypothetical protein
VASLKLSFIKLILSGARKSFAVTLTILQGIWNDLQELAKGNSRLPRLLQMATYLNYEKNLKKSQARDKGLG